ncbi:purine permease [Trifolium repens]|nr:purine permease [Trifolium repens]
MDARGANTFLSHNQLPNLNQGFSDISLSPHGINKRRWRLHCMKNGSDFPARYTWQVCSVGLVGLIFLVSSLYSNVISTMSLAITPITAVIVFHDKMNGVKIISMLMALWGFASYIYQNYLDNLKARRARAVASTPRDESSC